jgi:hypothetical protein
VERRIAAGSEDGRRRRILATQAVARAPHLSVSESDVFSCSSGRSRDTCHKLTASSLLAS